MNLQNLHTNWIFRIDVTLQYKLIWCQLCLSPWCGGSLSKTEEELFFGFWRSSVTSSSGARRASNAPLQLHVENLCVTALRLAIHRWDFPKFYSLVIKLTISKRLFLAQFTRLLKFLLLNWVYISPLDWQFDDKFGNSISWVNWVGIWCNRFRFIWHRFSALFGFLN